MPDADWRQALWPDCVTVLVEMGVRPDMVVADLCCGDGLFTAPLAHIAESIYAIDIDPAMLDRARRSLLELVRATVVSSWRTL
jgi:ubiquinone/menaquinone biosynthesis C-methylase UbiE